MSHPLRGVAALLVVAHVLGTTFPAMKVLTVYLRETMTERGWIGAALLISSLLISGMIVSQWNSERRPAGALVPA